MDDGSCPNCGCHQLQTCDCPSGVDTTIVRLEKEVTRLKEKLVRQQEAHMKDRHDDALAEAFAFKELETAYDDLQKESIRLRGLWELEAKRARKAEEEGFWDRVRMVRAEGLLKDLLVTTQTYMEWPSIDAQNKAIQKVLDKAEALKHKSIATFDPIEIKDEDIIDG